MNSITNPDAIDRTYLLRETVYSKGCTQLSRVGFFTLVDAMPVFVASIDGTDPTELSRMSLRDILSLLQAVPESYVPVDDPNMPDLVVSLGSGDVETVTWFESVGLVEGVVQNPQADNGLFYPAILCGNEFLFYYLQCNSSHGLQASPCTQFYFNDSAIGRFSTVDTLSNGVGLIARGSQIVRIKFAFDELRPSLDGFVEPGISVGQGQVRPMNLRAEQMKNFVDNLVMQLVG